MTVTHTLKTPVSHNGVTYEELTFRKPRTGDLVLMDGFQGEMAKTLALLASISDVPLPAFKMIELDDFQELQVKIVPLLGNSPAVTTGLTS